VEVEPGVDPSCVRFAAEGATEARIDAGGALVLATGAGERPMPWAEKDMMIVLNEADAARVALPLCGVSKEVIKGIKVERGEA